MNKRLSNCCARRQPGPLSGSLDGGRGANRAEQNPQVPLASEDASLWQVPGNAETARSGNRAAVAAPLAKAVPLSTCRPADLTELTDAGGDDGSTTCIHLRTAHRPCRQLNDMGTRRLICAVVEQAVADYRLLTKRGRIVDGKVVPAKHSKCGWVRETENYAAETLHFFRPGGPMDQWLGAAGIDINPNQIRRKLGIA